MSLVTRCPGCGTAFRVQRDQLSARGGRVRCGKCSSVFDGVAALIDDGGERIALEPSPQLGLFDPSRRPAFSATANDEPVPEFLAPLEPPRHHAWLWAFAALVAGVALATQAVYVYRAEIAASAPEARAPLEAFCRLLRCAVVLPRHAEQMTIESSDLQADPGREGIIVLNALLRNRAALPQAYPALELTLTDTGGRAVLRRVLMPADYLEPARARQSALGIAPGGEVSVRVYLDSSRARATGYRLYLFYPA